jgi:hypothetical protein
MLKDEERKGVVVYQQESKSQDVGRKQEPTPGHTKTTAYQIALPETPSIIFFLLQCMLSPGRSRFFVDASLFSRELKVESPTTGRDREQL